jgi:TRAP-type C4-dicarboxylate transport system permease small subunit
LEQKEKLNPVLSAITYFIDFLYGILLRYSQVVLVVIVIVVSVQVISRKFLGTSIRWSEEVALFFMIWMAFISMAIGVQKGLHIAVGFFYNLFSPGIAKIITKIDDLIVFFFGIFMMYYGSILVKSTMSSTLPATQWPAGLEYLMIPVGGFFITYFTFIDIFGLDRYEHHKLYEDDAVTGNVQADEKKEGADNV